MRQPNFGPPRERAQAGFQKVDREKRATLLRMSSFVFKHYKWAIIVVMACVVISSLTSLVSSLFTKTLIDDYVVPLTQVDNPLTDLPGVFPLYEDPYRRLCRTPDTGGQSRIPVLGSDFVCDRTHPVLRNSLLLYL